MSRRRTPQFGHTELPPEQQRALQKARRIQYLWLGILTLTVAAMAAVMGNSQAMKTAWIEDMLSFLPPLAFLIGARLAAKTPNERFPFGYHRAVGVGHLVSGVALAGVGLLLIADGGSSLLLGERPPIGAINLFGTPVWLGWHMIVVALASCIAPVILGRIKRRLAEQLHDKVLRADADMNRADWLTGLATATGVAGIGLGWWWADAAAALVISVSITKDGWENIRDAIRDLADARATTVDNSAPHPLIARINARIQQEPQVVSVQTRARDEGHVLHVEAFLQVREPRLEVAWLEELRRSCTEMDWRIQDLVLSVTDTPHGEGDDAQGDQDFAAA
ncbi:cation diffusion facilitator family transporter [Nesterenkonia flava]|uniref:Cation diffusion facilitator family transporter n=1 Tax=Nesterenkonia flava TaxID=469799 RepID=A0ABU1FU84_9MICC|nr:cation diffusion facilitator family transporter [Nesterenkonia flava]MDR5711738.1 cation diffusion facilitator family transporter [Nesterenkonia flava]